MVSTLDCKGWGVLRGHNSKYWWTCQRWTDQANFQIKSAFLLSVFSKTSIKFKFNRILNWIWWGKRFLNQNPLQLYEWFKPWKPKIFFLSIFLLYYCIQLSVLFVIIYRYFLIFYRFNRIVELKKLNRKNQL